MPASKAIDLITKKHDSFGLSLDKDIVASVTDGASLMKKIGYDTKLEHQMCYNHAIHLCVVDVLLKKIMLRYQTIILSMKIPLKLLIMMMMAMRKKVKIRSNMFKIFKYLLKIWCHH